MSRSWFHICYVLRVPTTITVPRGEWKRIPSSSLWRQGERPDTFHKGKEGTVEYTRALMAAMNDAIDIGPTQVNLTTHSFFWDEEGNVWMAITELGMTDGSKRRMFPPETVESVTTEATAGSGIGSGF